MLTLTAVLLSLLLLGYITNQVGIQKREGKTWVIRKGKHYSEWNWFPLVLKKRKYVGEQSTVEFTVTPEMLHDLPGEENDWDTNKVTGEGSLSWSTLTQARDWRLAPHHVNSWRVGWNFVPSATQGDRIQIILYMYRDRERFIQTLAEFNWQGLNTIHLLLTVRRFNTFTEFTLVNKTTGVELVKTTAALSLNNQWTYRLRPFFGGQEPAPKDTPVWYRFLT